MIIIILLKLCLLFYFNNYFTFNNTTYNSNKSLRIENPLSTFLIEMFMDKIKRNVQEHPMNNDLF